MLNVFSFSFHAYLLFDICAVLAPTKQPVRHPVNHLTYTTTGNPFRFHSVLLLRCHTHINTHFTQRLHRVYDNDSSANIHKTHTHIYAPARNLQSEHFCRLRLRHGTNISSKLELSVSLTVTVYLLRLLAACSLVFIWFLSVFFFLFNNLFLFHNVYVSWACKWNTILTRQFTWVLALILQRIHCEQRHEVRVRCNQTHKNGKLKHFMSKVEIAFYLEEIRCAYE